MFKGISAVIATVLLLMVTVSIVWIFSTWSTRTVSETTEKVGKSLERGVGKLSSCMKISSVGWNKIYLYNCGEKNSEITESALSIFVDGIMVNFTMNPSSIKGGETGEITLKGLWKFPLGEHTVKIISANGISAIKIVKFKPHPSAVLVLTFDEGTVRSDIAVDLIQGLEINLVKNNPGELVDGKFGKAYKFHGEGWQTTNFGKGIGKAVTYAFWFKLPDTSDTYGTFFCTEDVSSSTLEDNLGQVFSSSKYGDRGCGGNIWESSNLMVNDDRWHFYFFSKTSNSLLCRDDICENVGDATSNVPNVKIIKFNGGCGCGYGNFAQGIILDQIMIFSQALDPDEIYWMED